MIRNPKSLFHQTDLPFCHQWRTTQLNLTSGKMLPIQSTNPLSPLYMTTPGLRHFMSKTLRTSPPSKTRSKNGPPQCKNCQNYGHTAKYCHHLARCIKCGGDHSSDICTKEKSSPAMCALCADDHTSNYKGCPKYKELLKHRKCTHTIRRNPNTVLTSNILKPSPHPPKASYSSINDHKNTLFSKNSINDHIFSKFISELSSLIYPLISLLTAVLHNQTIP